MKILKRVIELPRKSSTSSKRVPTHKGPSTFPFIFLDSEKEGYLTIGIPQNIKRADYIAAWEDLQDYLHPKTYPPTPKPKIKRLRAADDTQLIYAIHKARWRGLTFKQVFELYQAGMLDCYSDKVTNQFSSEDSLERYYNKYKPDR